MIRLKPALLTVATLLILLGTWAATSFYIAYPEDAPMPTWLLIAAGAALWLASSFLILKLPDRN